MKKVLTTLIAVILFSSLALASTEAPKTGSKVGTGFTIGQSVEKGMEVGEVLSGRVLARNVSQLREMMRNREHEMEQELQTAGEQVRNVHRNQNIIRLAVHSLLAMENLTGGIGQNVSRIARDFNNSIQSTMESEERMENRAGLTRFLFGGDEEAAGKMGQEVVRNKERIQELKQLNNQCNCTDGVKEIIQEQIQNMESEQARLSRKVLEEKQDKGILGWLWK